VNPVVILDRIFMIERGRGYPAHRKEPQQTALKALETVSALTHRPFDEIITVLPDDVLLPDVEYPGTQELIDIPSIEEPALKAAIVKMLGS